METITHAVREDGTVLIPASKRYGSPGAMIALYAATITLLGFFVGYYFVGQSSDLFSVITVLSVMILASVLGKRCSSLIRRRRHSPALVADLNGVTDNTGAIPGGLVRWDEISRMTTVTEEGEPLLLLLLNDPEMYLRRMPVRYQGLLRQNVPLYGTPCVVSQDDIDMPIDEAQTLLEHAQARFARPAKVAAPVVSTASSAHWWTAVPPEERVARPLRQGAGHSDR